MTLRIDVINRVLVEIGANEVTEEVQPGPDYVKIYETHVGGLISSYPWNCQTRLRQLARLSATPDAQRKYQFELPADMRGAPRAAYPDKDSRDPTTDWELRGNRLFSDHPEIWLFYTFTLNPALWPDYLMRLAVTALKAELVDAVKEDSVKAEKLRRIAFGPPSQLGEGGMIAEAKKIDAQSKPAPRLRVGKNPLTSVRTVG